jgi:hypothetical protein
VPRQNSIHLYFQQLRLSFVSLRQPFIDLVF